MAYWFAIVNLCAGMIFMRLAQRSTDFEHAERAWIATFAWLFGAFAVLFGGACARLVR